MKGVRKTYRTVEQLPADAIRVRTYADNHSITVAYVYKLNSNGKIEIVNFEGINFVLVNSN